MRFSMSHTVGVGDVGPDGRIRPDSMTRLMQNAAVAHSDAVGYSAERLAAMNRAWMLSSFAFAQDMPVGYSDRLTITTWSRGVDRFRGYREYLISTNDGIACRATSTWVLIDTARRRPARVVDEMAEAYGQDTSRALDDDIPPPLSSGQGERRVIGVRRADFDLNGHMNNASYVACIETAASVVVPESIPFTRFAIRFHHEVTPDVTALDIAIGSQGDAWGFMVSSGDVLHASGGFSGGDAKKI